MEKLRVGIVFGGKSAEHEVSLQSAKNIVDAIDKSRFDVVLLGIDKQGQWHVSDASNYLLNADDPAHIALRPSATSLAQVPGKHEHQLIDAQNGQPLLTVDVIFPIVHGTLGEDGSLQGMLRVANLPFVGSDVLASAACMDKDVTKRLLRDAGLNIAPFITLTRANRHNISFAEVESKLGLPLFVKPANQGSSVGVSKVTSEEQYAIAVDLAFEFDHKVIVEQGIKGREIECAVLGNDNPQASTCGEIVLTSDFYAYDTLAKLGEALMYSYHCYEDVPQLAGKPAVFIKQCAPKICIQPAYRKPVHVTGSLVQIDRNGSYTATYTEFEGIPRGVPKVIDPEMWLEIKCSATYYYVLIDVHSARCRHLDDRFELVTTGQITPQGGHGSAMFIDRNMLEFIEQHYDVDYTFISGYYFDSGFNTNIKRLATDLYRLRQQLKHDGQRIESCIKTILSSLWGKAQPKRRITKEVSVTRDRLDDFVVYNKDFLSRSTPVTDDVTIFSLLNPVTLHYTRPQFSTNVLSHARTTLNSIFYRAADNDIPIYYSNTDSLVLNTADLDKLNRLGGNDLIGDDLGQFKRERENICTFICLSPKKYIQRTVGDVDTKIVGLRRKNGHDRSPADVEQTFAEWYRSSVSDDRDGRPVDLPGHSPDD